ncbi:MAG: aldehyde dehydrogenase [Pelagibacterales bacterium]|nr:aldehyde dehydrogenase [Pelagibacterales bacterium]
MALAYNDVIDKKNSLDFRTQAFIGGNYVDSTSGKTFESISPVDGKIITNISECDVEDINKAVIAAREVFEKGSWSRMAPSKRKKILFNFADLMKKNILELGILETLNMGKPITRATGDIAACINCTKWYAEAIDKIYDDVAPTGDNIIATITREPIGVVGAVTPWNYPLLMACWKFAPALATGNSFILKPAEQSPLSALRIAELAIEAGMPEGVFNVVPGFGPTAGKALGMHMDVDKLGFTGSTEVGRYFLSYSGQSNMKRVSLECGGKSPNIIFADAPDLDHAAKMAADGMFGNSGQVCDAPSRLLIEKSIKDEFLEKVSEYSKPWMPDDPFKPETLMGSIVDKTQTERILDYIDTGKNEGANVLTGGEQVKQDSGGYYISPTIFKDVKNDMKVAKEEIFGPVLCSIDFENEDDALKIANDTKYGLNAIIWSNDLNKVHKLAKRIKSGKVLINSVSDGDMSLPHGGYKQSGFGRDKSLEALDQYTQSKLTLIETR